MDPRKCLSCHPEETCSSTNNETVYVKRDRFIAEFVDKHNLPAQAGKDMIPILNHLIQNPELVDKIDLNADKFSKLLKNVFFKCEFDRVKDILNKTYFSIVMQTRVSDDEHITYVSVRYMEPNDGKIVQHHLHMIELKARNHPQLRIFKAFKKYFEDNNINMQNIVAVMYDSTDIETEDDEIQFEEHLEKVLPHLIILEPVSHFSSLVDFQDNYGLIAKRVDHLISSISEYFTENVNSSEEYQNYLHSLSKDDSSESSKTPLLEFHRYHKILHEWSALENFFQNEIIKLTKSNIHKKILNAKNILSLLQDNSVKAYAYFLKHCLSYHESLNSFYKCKNVLIYRLMNSIEATLRKLGMNFIKDEMLSRISMGDFNISKSLKPINEIYLGPNCSELIKDMSTENMQRFRENCLYLYEVTLENMRNKVFDFEFNLLGKLHFLNPKVALTFKDRTNIPVFNGLRKIHFPFISANSIVTEWKTLPKTFNDNEKEKYLKLNIETFWKTICDCKNDAGTALRFPSLKKLIQFVFSLPHSICDLERIISDIYIIKDFKEHKEDKKLLNARSFLQSILNAYSMKFSDLKSNKKYSELMKKYNV